MVTLEMLDLTCAVELDFESVLKKNVIYALVIKTENHRHLIESETW